MTFKLSKTSAVVAAVVCVIAAVALATTLYFTYSYSVYTNDVALPETRPTETSDVIGDKTLCGYCGAEINVTLRVEHDLKDPKFNHSFQVTGRQRELVYFLQQAAVTEQEFRFSGDFGKYGLLITAINGLKADFIEDGTWWQILNGSYVPLSKGVSSYIPEHEETIIFTLAKSSEH